MKKLMFGLAIAAVGTAFAVESSNIVGYLGHGVANGYSAETATFVNAGAETISIQDFVAVDAEGERQGGATFQLQTKAPSGGTDEQFAYLFEDDVGEDLGDGWYNGDGETLATKVFAPGEGFVFNSSVSGGKLQFAGEVIKEAVDVAVPNGYSAVGNLRPVSVSIQNMIPVNAAGETVGGATFQLQTKAPSGGADEQFVYLFEDDVGEDLGDGWYNGDGETLATKVFAPGDGFVFNSSITGGKLKFAALDL